MKFQTEAACLSLNFNGSVIVWYDKQLLWLGLRIHNFVIKFAVKIFNGPNLFLHVSYKDYVYTLN